MKILLVAATKAEIQPTLDWLPGIDAGTQTLITGIGMVPATFHLTRHLTGKSSYHLVIQAGICGAYDRSLELGEVVQVTRDRFLAQGAEERDGSWLSLTDIGFPPADPFDAKGWLEGDLPPGFTLPYRAVIGGTIDRSSGATSTIDRIVNRYPEVQTESMEGAAVHYVCRQYGIPVLQLRSISNYVEPRDRSKWQIGPAIRHLNEALREVLQAAAKL